VIRPASAGLADALATSHGVSVRVDCWRGPRLTAQDIPIIDGAWTEQGDQLVPETVRITLPAVGPDGRQWTPSGRGDATPIGIDGHRLRITYLIPRTDTLTEECALGVVRLTDWEPDSGQLTFTGEGLLSVLRDYSLLAPTSPLPASTLTAEARRLLDARLPLDLTTVLDAPCPAALAWDSDRLAAIADITTALNATMRVDPGGVLTLTPNPSAWSPDLELQEAGGTIIEATAGGTRDGTANVIVTRGDAVASGFQAVWGWAVDDDPASPTYVSLYDPVVKVYSSPLLTEWSQAEQAARSLLRQCQLGAQQIELSTVPDPRITVGTRINLRRADGTQTRTEVQALELPLTAAGGAETMTLGVLP